MQGKSPEITTVAQIKKRFGEGSIMKLGDSTSMQVEAIPTGCLALDLALGIGGVPRGTHHRNLWPESSARQRLCQHIIAECQKMAGVAAFIDVEHALDPGYARKCGVDVDQLFISQPRYRRAGAGDNRGFGAKRGSRCRGDRSVADWYSGEIEGDMGDSHMGLQARLMSGASENSPGESNVPNCAVIFRINCA